MYPIRWGEKCAVGRTAKHSFESEFSVCMLISKMANFLFSVFVATLFQFSLSVKVSLYYESLCYDSSKFIALQLSPNYSKLKNYIQLEFIPYGKATHNYINNKWIFDCQHGPNECLGNKYQSCALAQENGQDKDLAFVDCVMRNRNPADLRRIENCAKRTGFDWENISKCSMGASGDDLLVGNGNKTNELEPNIYFVPTVVYDDKFDDRMQEMSLIDFTAVVCSKIKGEKPGVCNDKKLPRKRSFADFFF